MGAPERGGAPIVAQRRSARHARLAAAVHRDGAARGILGLHPVLLAVEAIDHVEVLRAPAGRRARAAAHVLRVDRGAARVVARDVGADRGAGDGADARGYVVAAAAADLVAEDATQDAAEDGTANLVAAVGHALALD